MKTSGLEAESRLSIGLLTPGWPADVFPNGIATYVHSIAGSLRNLGHRVTILAFNRAEGCIDPDVCEVGRSRMRRSSATKVFESLGVRLAPEIAGPYFIRRTLSNAIRRVVIERNIQVLEMEESFGWARRVRRSIPAAVCVRLHGPWFLSGRALGLPEDGSFRRRVESERQGILSADVVSAPSQALLDQIKEYYSLPLSNAEAIPNPTQMVPAADRWRPETSDNRKVLFIGRFDRLKGGDLIVDSFRLVLREFADAKLCFVGPDRGCIDSDGRTWNLESFVRDRIPEAVESGTFEWLGHQPRNVLHTLRRQAAVTVIPSRYDNFPGTALEALASGCPIVAARVGGIPEIVRDGLTGRLHRAGDSRDLAEKIAAILRDPSAAAEMGSRAAADCAQRFHPDVIASRLVKTYRAALQARGR